METIHTEVVVIGSGPAGYPAAFRSADLGKKVVLIDPEVNPGGVCLYRGCIPSKALLHVAALIEEAEEASHWGVSFGKPQLDLDKIRAYKANIVDKITKGVGGLSKSRQIQHLQGYGKFLDNHTVEVTLIKGETIQVKFQNAVIAAGSRPFLLPAFDLKSDRIMTSTEALNLPDIPKKMLCIGGGVIGMELATVYAALGSEITVVELQPEILAGADSDLVRPLVTRMKKKLTIHTGTKVLSLKDLGKSIEAQLDFGNGKIESHGYDRVLVSMGRLPNTDKLGIENTSIKLSSRKFIEVNSQMRTSVEHIFAVGDIVGDPMLAHKGTHEGHVAAEVIAGNKVEFHPSTIPSVVYTNPEIAWCGLTETEAQKNNVPYQLAKFPWGASGRATANSRADGLTKILFEPETGRVLGVGICGVNAGELIGEGILAVEMGALASDLAHAIHPHPTLTESIMEASEIFLGHCDHYLVPKKKH